MPAAKKPADLTKFRQTDDFYAIDITRDGPYMLANSTNVGDFYPTDYIMSYLSEADDLTNFSKIRQSKISFAELASRRNVIFFSFVTFKPWLSIGVFLLLCLASSVHDELAAHNAKCISIERENSCPFSYCRENQMHGVTPGPINQNCSIKSLPSCPSGGHTL